MRQWTVDAFASVPFKGNPACVVEPLDSWPSDSWMQALAAENHQAETAFLLKSEDAHRFGSAHCLIAPLFAAKLGRDELRFYQAYPGRGAEIETKLRGDRIILSGRAVTVIESLLRGVITRDNY